MINVAAPLGRFPFCCRPLGFLEKMFLGDCCERCDEGFAIYDTWRSIMLAMQTLIDREGKR